MKLYILILFLLLYFVAYLISPNAIHVVLLW